MPLRSKIILKSDLSQETLTAVRTYLRRFLHRRHSLENFAGSFSIYLRDPADARLLRQQFGALIADVQDVR
jgi:hypothetical protein